MRIQKIEKFEKVQLADSYSVWYEGIVNQRVVMSKVEFALAQCIDEFLRRAIDPKDIERIVDLSRRTAYADYEENLD